MTIEQGTPVYCSPATEVRFTAKVVVTPGCHYWIGAIADDSYGRFTADHRTVRASRFLWTAHYGPLPPTTVVMHQVCDEPICVRLADLRAGSQAENLATAARRDRSSGWRHTGRADRRGMATRSRAIRAALLDGHDPDRLAAVLAAGDPRAQWGVLF